MHRISFKDKEAGESVLDPRIVQHSQVLSQLIAHHDSHDDHSVIPLINVTQKTYEHLKTLIGGLDDVEYTDSGIVCHGQTYTLNGEFFNVSEQAKTFLQTCVRKHLAFLQSLDKPDMLDLAHATMYLDMPYARDVICMYLANLFNDMSVAEVKAYISD